MSAEKEKIVNRPGAIIKTVPDFEKVLDFWFEGVTDAIRVDRNAPPFCKWFARNDSFDSEIRGKFENDLLRAAEGAYSSWNDAAAGRLALVLLFDQFPRNLYRDSPKAFAYDPKALELALRAIQEKIDEDFPLVQRVFLYMPLMHAEDILVQRKSVESFERLVESCRKKNPVNVPYFVSNLYYARKHCEVIERFGRFPHRNDILQRVSTPEEVSFLQWRGAGL